MVMGESPLEGVARHGVVGVLLASCVFGDASINVCVGGDVLPSPLPPSPPCMRGRERERKEGDESGHTIVHTSGRCMLADSRYELAYGE
jgi:hypothetical protein